MANDKTEIPGAPTWVQEFLQRVDDKLEVHGSQEMELLSKLGISNKTLLTAVNDLSGSVGQIAGAVSRLDRKVEYLRGELRTTREEVNLHGGRLQQLETELSEVRDRMDELALIADVIQAEIRKRREEDLSGSPEPDEAPAETQPAEAK